jgi:hypothetical protein
MRAKSFSLNSPYVLHSPTITQQDFCVSAIPPFAFSHAREIGRELRAKYPRAKIIIRVWGFGGEIERALVRFQPSPPDKFVRSLAEALEYLGASPIPEGFVSELDREQKPDGHVSVA